MPPRIKVYLTELEARETIYALGEQCDMLKREDTDRELGIQLAAAERAQTKIVNALRAKALAAHR